MAASPPDSVVIGWSSTASGRPSRASGLLDPGVVVGGAEVQPRVQRGVVALGRAAGRGRRPAPRWPPPAPPWPRRRRCGGPGTPAPVSPARRSGSWSSRPTVAARRLALDRAAVRADATGQDLAAASTCRPRWADQAVAVPGRDGEADPVEDGQPADGHGDVAGDEGAGTAQAGSQCSYRRPTIDARGLLLDLGAGRAAGPGPQGGARRRSPATAGHNDSWINGFSREFSRELAAHGWIGMTWPVEHGGGGRPPIERLIVAEEMISAGAPLAALVVRRPADGPDAHDLRHARADRRASSPASCPARRRGASG